MADIVVTAANVLQGASAVVRSGRAGEAITAGQVVYLAADGDMNLAIETDALTAAAKGIALHDAAAGQPIDFLISGDINPGGTVVVGEVYNVSPNAGGIAPDLDVTSGAFRTTLGIGKTASILTVQILASGVAVP